MTIVLVGNLSLHERYMLKMLLSSTMILSNSPIACPSLPTSTARYSWTLLPNCQKNYINSRKKKKGLIFLKFCSEIPYHCLCPVAFLICRVPSWKLFRWKMMGLSELEELLLIQWHPESEKRQHVLYRKMVMMPLLGLMYLSLLITLSFWNT